MAAFNPVGLPVEIAGTVRHLCGAVELEAVGDRIVARERSSGLDRHARMAPDPELELDGRAVRNPASLSP